MTRCDLGTDCLCTPAMRATCEFMPPCACRHQPAPHPERPAGEAFGWDDEAPAPLPLWQLALLWLALAAAAILLALAAFRGLLFLLGAP